MAYLKHIYVFECAVFELSYLPERSIISACIEKLSTLYLDDCMLAKVMRRLRSLRKLKCNWYKNKGGRQFPVVDLLNDLESLNIKCCCSFSKVNLSEFSFPSNLKKLTLSYFRLPWSEISKIGRLPQLKVLKLLSEAFMGQRWEASDDEFRNLKFLKLEGLNIVGWDASLDAFPRLEQLVLQSCRRLEEIPSSFGESSTLQMIKVKECRNSITEAVLKIKEEQHDLGAAEFKKKKKRVVSRAYAKIVALKEWFG